MELVVADVGGRVDADERRELDAELARVQPRGVAAQVAALLQPLHALVHREVPNPTDRRVRQRSNARFAGARVRGGGRDRRGHLPLFGPFAEERDEFRRSGRLYRIYPEFIVVGRMKATFAAGLALLGLLAGFAASFAAPGAETVRFDIAADPSSLDPLFAHARCRRRRRAARALDVRAVHRRRRARERSFPSCSRRSRPCERRASRRTGGRSSTICARACAGATAPRSRAATSCSRCMRSSTRERGRLARRLRADRPRGCAGRADGPLPSASDAGRRRSRRSSVRHGAAIRFPRAVLRGQSPLAQAPFSAAPSVGDGPFTFVSWQRGERSRTAQPALLAGRRRSRRARRRHRPRAADQSYAAAIRRRSSAT